MRQEIIIAMLASTILVACSDGISSAKIEAGKKVYATYCQSCHMDDGGGVPDMNAPLLGSAYVVGDKEKLISIVLQGSAAFEGGVERPYRNVMASMAQLSNEQISDVLTYIRNSFSNKADAISSEEVQSVRAKTK
jgi:mono/diheme cytochrome c family protein